MDDAVSFVDELSQPVINLPRAALRFSQELSYPTLNITTYLARLQAISDAARPYVTQCVKTNERVEALSDFLFGRMAFRGDVAQYHDPENSFLNRVLDRRLGLPISLSLLYITTAQRLGINAYGIGLPGHFIVGVFEDGKEIFVDPFNGGRRLKISDCARLVQQTTGATKPFQQRWLRPVAPVDLLARMLTNLMNAYIRCEDWHKAILVMQHLQVLHPNRDAHLRDLGYLYLYNGSLREAANTLEEYLRRSPDAEDYEPVRSSLSIVAGRLTLWN